MCVSTSPCMRASGVQAEDPVGPVDAPSMTQRGEVPTRSGALKVQVHVTHVQPKPPL